MARCYGRIVAQITPGILVGNAAGARSSLRQLCQPNRWRCFFTAFVCLVAVQMIFNLKPKACSRVAGRRPASLPLVAASAHYRRWSRSVADRLPCLFLPGATCAYRHAIGTSAAIGFPIAVGGSLGYIFNGWGHPGLAAMESGLRLSAGVHLAGAVEHVDGTAGGKDWRTACRWPP
jgi:uncharacterized membrane protein YfcA